VGLGDRLREVVDHKHLLNKISFADQISEENRKLCLRFVVNDFFNLFAILLPKK